MNDINAMSVSEIAKLKTRFDSEAVEVLRVEGHEGLSELFYFDVDLYGTTGKLVFPDCIATPAALTMRFKDGGSRLVHGIISSISLREERELGKAVYRVRLVPEMWLLTQRTDCRIFHNLNVKEILTKVYRSLGLSNFEFNLSTTLSPREYCVQYRETDFQFVSRLMEDEGIFYYFREEKDHHVLVMTDSTHSCLACPTQPEISFWRDSRTQSETWESRQDRLQNWEYRRKIHSGQHAMKSFIFEDPSQDLLVQTRTTETAAVDDLEVFEYPARFGTINEGESLSKSRMEALESEGIRIFAHTGAAALCPGQTFELVNHYRDDFNTDYLLVTVDHLLDGNEESEAAASDHSSSIYQNSISCVPKSTRYRPALQTPKPIVQGSQTAIVVGPENEEIWTDEHGRVKLRFHWDRWGRSADDGEDWDTSCFVRVSQSSAGTGWGSIFLPRIGQEVVVDFLNGDPDQPVITGVLYNGSSKTPYDLPEKSTISGFKSRSSKGGGGFNEVRIDDKKDSEQLFVHAQRNFDLRVKNDAFEEIDHNRHQTVTLDQMVQIKNDSHFTVDNHRYEAVAADYHRNTGGKQAIEVKETLSLSVGGNVMEVFQADHSEQTTGDLFIKAAGVVIEATDGITLKVGGSNIVIDSAGVTITGATVVVDGSMVKIASGPGSSPNSLSAGALVPPTKPTLP